MLNDLIILVNREKNIPIIIKGIPNPNEYDNNKVNDCPGVVAAKVRMLPKIGPMHGVQQVAKANPKTNESG